jgi:hypothetical protein
MRCSVNDGQAAPPFEGGVMTVRTHVSVRVWSPPEQALHSVADWNVQALTTQSTGPGDTVAVLVTLPPGPVATNVKVVVVLMVNCCDPDAATAVPFSVTVVAFVVVQLTLAVFVPLNVAVSVAVGAGVPGVTVAVLVTLPPGPVATSV